MTSRAVHFSIFASYILLGVVDTKERVVKVNVKTIACTEINYKYIERDICFVKRTRDGSGLVTVETFGLKSTSDIWMSTDTFTKYGQRWQKIFPTFDLNVCRLHELKKSMFHNYISDLFEGLDDTVPELLHPCPYSGYIGVTNLSVARIFEKAFPHIIPRGMYKVVVRYYQKRGDVTYGVLSGTAEVK